MTRSRQPATCTHGCMEGSTASRRLGQYTERQAGWRKWMPQQCDTRHLFAHGWHHLVGAAQPPDLAAACHWVLPHRHSSTLHHHAAAFASVSSTQEHTTASLAWSFANASSGVTTTCTHQNGQRGQRIATGAGRLYRCKAMQARLRPRRPRRTSQVGLACRQGQQPLPSDYSKALQLHSSLPSTHRDLVPVQRRQLERQALAAACKEGGQRSWLSRGAG